MKYVRLALFFGMLTGCTTTVTDRTESPLTFNTEGNAQRIAVDVYASSDILSVAADLLDVGSVAMVETGDPDYSATVELPRCAAAAQFKVTVETDGGFGGATRQTFPDAGYFSHRIIDRPRDCGPGAGDSALSLTVDTTEDYVDTRPGDGRCRGEGFGLPGCSLRAAVMEANASPGSDLISIPPGRYRLTLRDRGRSPDSDERLGDLDISDDVTIVGLVDENASLTDILVERNSLEFSEEWRDDPSTDSVYPKVESPYGRAFEIMEGTSVRMSNLVITGSNPNDYVQHLRGGGLENSGQLSLSRVIFVGNQAFDGGGLFNFGTLVAEDTAFIGNSAPGSAFVNQGSATFRRALIAFGLNTGAAIWTGKATIDRDSTEPFTGARTRLENVTIFKNVYGSQVYTTPGNETDLIHVTISDSSWDPPQQNQMIGGNASGGATRLRNSLLLRGVTIPSVPICEGNIISTGGNVANEPCVVTGDASAPDRFNQTALNWRARLFDRGGFLPVIETRGAAANIDAGVPAGAPPHDQRGPGYPRSLDGDGDGVSQPDAGAYER